MKTNSKIRNFTDNDWYTIQDAVETVNGTKIYSRTMSDLQIIAVVADGRDGLHFYLIHGDEETITFHRQIGSDMSWNTKMFALAMAVQVFKSVRTRYEAARVLAEVAREIENL